MSEDRLRPMVRPTRAWSLGGTWIGAKEVTHCSRCRRYIPVAEEPHLCAPPDGRPLVAFLLARLGEFPASPLVAAVRDVIDLHHDPEWADSCRVCATSVGHLDDMHDDAPCDTLRRLAATFADHEDYDERWRP